MEPTTSGTDGLPANHRNQGASVPWTPSDILDDALVIEPNPLCALVPFVVQAGPALWMVESSVYGWTLAELRFHPRYGFFQEQRRATYAWPREAFGVMLSHLGAFDLDIEAVEALTEEFGDWLGPQTTPRSDRCGVSC